jgi:hypothetical protein
MDDFAGLCNTGRRGAVSCPPDRRNVLERELWMASSTARNSMTLTRRRLIAAAALAAAAFGMSSGMFGCASKSSHQWAQTSPVIAAEPQDTAVQLGAQGG